MGKWVNAELTLLLRDGNARFGFYDSNSSWHGLGGHIVPDSADGQSAYLWSQQTNKAADSITESAALLTSN